jgi:hypothetical protein
LLLGEVMLLLGELLLLLKHLLPLYASKELLRSYEFRVVLGHALFLQLLILQECFLYLRLTYTRRNGRARWLHSLG